MLKKKAWGVDLSVLLALGGKTFIEASVLPDPESKKWAKCLLRQYKYKLKSQIRADLGKSVANKKHKKVCVCVRI